MPLQRTLRTAIVRNARVGGDSRAGEAEHVSCIQQRKNPGPSGIRVLRFCSVLYRSGQGSQGGAVCALSLLRKYGGAQVLDSAVVVAPCGVGVVIPLTVVIASGAFAARCGKFTF